MLKKLILLGMSVATLLAFAAPPAQATGPLVTNALGEPSIHTELVSTNTLIQTSMGTVGCATVQATYQTTTNANTTVEGHASSTMTGTPGVSHFGHCGAGSGIRTEVTGIIISGFHLTKHGAETTGITSVSYTYDLRTSGGGLIAECTWGGTLPVKKTGTSTLNIEGKLTKTAGTAFCPAEGTFKGDSSVTDELGLPVTIH